MASMGATDVKNLGKAKTSGPRWPSSTPRWTAANCRFYPPSIFIRDQHLVSIACMCLVPPPVREKAAMAPVQPRSTKSARPSGRSTRTALPRRPTARQREQGADPPMGDDEGAGMILEPTTCRGPRASVPQPVSPPRPVPRTSGQPGGHLEDVGSGTANGIKDPDVWVSA